MMMMHVMRVFCSSFLFQLTTLFSPLLHHPPSPSPSSSSYRLSYATARRTKKRKKKKSRADLKANTLPPSDRRFDAILLEEKKHAFLLRMKELLIRQPEHVLPMSDLGKMRRELGIVSRTRKVSTRVRKYPYLFDFCVDEDNKTWCGFTDEVEELLLEEERVREAYEPELVRKLRKILMMSVDKRILLVKIVHIRRFLGLSDDFRKSLLGKYPYFFCVKKEGDESYLELTSWDPSLAITALEAQARKESSDQEAAPNEDTSQNSPRFELIFKKGFIHTKKQLEKIRQFQSAPYISPYLNSPDLQLVEGSLEAEKFAIALLHEFLSLTIEKRTLVELLGQFRREYRLPEKILPLLLQHDGIFYVKEKQPMSVLFLKEAYHGSNLIEKCPLVLLKERFLEIAAARRRSSQQCNDRILEEKEEVEDFLFEVTGQEGNKGA